MNTGINFQDIKPLAQIIPAVSTNLNFKDYRGAMMVRWGFNRGKYRVSPGLYKIGNPDSKSDVMVSANYKLSFDTLRKNLTGLNVWIMVIDTKGVNVWCAAGKGTFSTDNIVKSIQSTSLNNIVTHRQLIVPQLGATGVAAHKVKELCGFKVIFGPVRAGDIKDFIAADYNATTGMRRVYFPLKERLKLIPNDFMQGKYKLLAVLVILFVLSGLDQTGLHFQKMTATSLLPVINIIAAYFAGIVITPILLPVIPFRAFALKGAIAGYIIVSAINYPFSVPLLENMALTGLSTAMASFAAMNFTGSSTYTSLSGVKKEMKWAVPFQASFFIISLVIFITNKFL